VSRIEERGWGGGGAARPPRTLLVATGLHSFFDTRVC
jgi:hypothetical protein